ncbi:MAG: hypothetical protein OQK55_03300 [Thermoanaerobaculales bacterium]|nr:hypothetical protein [Thermoanaerobaculales bacterium]
MKTEIRGAVLVVVVALIVGSALPAGAQVVLSNRPWTNEGGPCVGADGANLTAVRFTVPVGEPYSLNTVTVKMHEVVSGVPLVMTLHDDAFGAAQPGNVIATLGTQTLGASNSYLEYVFPGGGQTLGGGLSYWIGVTVLDPAGCAAGFDFNAAAPTGVFTYSTTLQGIGGVYSPPGFVDIEIDAAFAAVQVPTLGKVGGVALVLLLAGAGVIALRRVWV